MNFVDVAKICQVSGVGYICPPPQAICLLSLGIRPSYVPIQITLGPQQYSVEQAAF